MYYIFIKFFAEDVVFLKKNEDKIGVVIKTTLDEDDEEDMETENVNIIF